MSEGKVVSTQDAAQVNALDAARSLYVAAYAKERGISAEDAAKELGERLGKVEDKTSKKLEAKLLHDVVVHLPNKAGQIVVLSGKSLRTCEARKKYIDELPQNAGPNRNVTVQRHVNGSK